MRRSCLRPEAPEQMSDFTTPEGCESPVSVRPLAATAAGELRLPVLSRLLTVYGLWVAVALLYWPSSIGLNALWTQPTHEEPFTHGYLVLAISLWLIFRERRQLAAAPVRALRPALIALVLLSALWVWAWRAEIQEIHLMLLPLILFSAVLAALGWRVARLLAFPIGYLYFAMPMWTDINGLVQTLSAKMSGVLIWITGLPAFMQGNYVRLPGGSIEIAQSCSGLHALIVGLALATLYGELSREPLRRRLQWIGVMGALALMINWVRIFTVLVAAYYTDMHSSLVKNHYWLGWWLFAAVFAGFLWWTGRQPTHGADERVIPDRKPAASSASGFGLARLSITLLALAFLPTLGYGMDWAHSHSRAAVRIGWPAAPTGWSGPRAVTGGEWHPHYVGFGGESLVEYTSAGARIEAFVVAYRVQTQNAKLLSYWNHLLGGAEGLRTRSVRIVNSRSGPWREILAVNRADARSLIWSRYRIGSGVFVRPRLSQIWYGLEALALRRPISTLTALRTACIPDCKAARRRLSAEASALQPAVR